MKLIGITGGVGAGKTMVLGLLKELCRCRVLLADEVGNEVKLPDSPAMSAWFSFWGGRCLPKTAPLTKRRWRV